MASPPSPAPLLRRTLLRAGAFGALFGGHPGDPRVGLTVLAQTAGELQEALAALEGCGVRATLLISPTLIRLDPAGLWGATQAGHEVAGQGDPAALVDLEATAGQAVTAWAPDALTGPQLRRLAAQGVRPLPPPSPVPEPGLTLRLTPGELARALPRLTALGYRPVPVRELPDLRPAVPRDLVLHLYRRLIEERFARAHGVLPLTGRAGGVMRVAARPAPGRLPLPPGTLAAELHLHSPRMVGLTARSALSAYRAYQRSLGDVALALRERPELHGARAVFAVTLFHGPLAKNGFTVVALPPLRARLYGLGFRLMRLVYGTTAAPSEAEPKLAWMEREAFLARHG